MCSKLILNSYKIVRKNITNIIILACFLFTGCSLAVPEPDEANQTLLIIPVESRQTLQKFIWTLHVSIEDSSSNEKHNHIIGTMMEKLWEDGFKDLKQNLASSLNAKNSMENNQGFSPYQLAIGIVCLFVVAGPLPKRHVAHTTLLIYIYIHTF